MTITATAQPIPDAREVEELLMSHPAIVDEAAKNAETCSYLARRASSAKRQRTTARVPGLFLTRNGEQRDEAGNRT